MKITTDEFIFKFHSLDGVTVGEKRKHLFHLFSSIPISASQDLNFSNLHPKSFFEENFKIDALLHFRRVPELLQVLKGGNHVHIAKVLKASDWLLEELFRDMSGKDLVENIFPYLSFNVKVKILNKLCVHLEDPKKGDDYFEAIRASYDLYLASKIIPCCSGELIMKYLRTYHIELTPAQLIIIIKKYPELTENIFEILNDYKSRIQIGMKYRYVFKYLMRNYHCMFLKLNEKYIQMFHIGRRATKQFIKLEEQNVIKNAKRIHERLNKKQTVRSLKDDFKSFYINLFPTSLNACNMEYDDLLSFLSCLPSNMQRANYFLICFKELYGKEVGEHPKLVTSKLLELMSPDEREVWIETHTRPSTMSEESWISFMKTEKSIPLLKERLSFTPEINARIKIVTSLVTTCKFNNNDYVALLDCCKYVAEHLHSDHHSVRQNFLRTITECFDMQKLEQHWVYIIQLMQLGFANDEYFYRVENILKAYIEYRLAKNLAIDEQLALWIQLQNYELELKGTKYQKQCLEKYCDFLLTTNKDDRQKDESSFMDCLNWISVWNKKHPQDQISWLPYEPYINRIKLLLEQNKSDWRIDDMLQLYIFLNINEKTNDLLNAYIACKNIEIKTKFVRNLVKYDTLSAVRHMNNITKHILRAWYSDRLRLLWHHLKNYFLIGIPQAICDTCKDVYNKDSDDDRDKDEAPAYWAPCKIKSTMLALSCLMDVEDFLNFIDVYNPKSITLDVNSKKGRFVRKIHKAIALSLRNIVPAERALINVLQFCTGDYLLFGRHSLLSIAYNVPENKLVPLLYKLSTQAVSVRKHAIYLLFKLTNKTQLQDILTKLMETDEDASIRKYLLKVSFNLFKNGPDPASWELVKQNALALNKSDRECITLLTKWKTIPSSYLVQHIPFTWDILEQCPNSDNVMEARCQILNAVSADVTEELPNEWFIKIIKKYLFKSKQLTTFESSVQSLACKSVIHSKSKSIQEERLNLTFKVLKDYISATWHNTETCVTGRNIVFKFIQEYCSNFLEGKCQDIAILTKLFCLWCDFMKPEDALNIYLYFQLTEKYLNCKTLDEIGRELIALYSTELSRSGVVINNCFNEALKIILHHFLLSSVAEVAEQNRYILMQNIVKSDAPGDYLMLVVFLLPDKVPRVSKYSITFNNIVMALMKSADPYTKVYLNEYLTNKSKLCY